MIFSETPRRQMVSKLVTWGHWFALCNIIVAICIAGIYLFSSSPPDSALGFAYLVANWFSHIGFLTFFGFVILILPFCYLYPNSKFLRFWSSFVAAIGLAFLAFDALLYTRHGLHFSLYSADFIKQQTNSVLTGLQPHNIAFLVISFFVWLMFQLLVANSLWHRIERLQRLRLGLPISAGFIVMFVFSHLTHIWADANLYQPVVRQDNMFPLSYPATAKTLLSKYGLMDLDKYRTKKRLQFDNQFQSISYPKKTFFCSVSEQTKTVTIFVNGNVPTDILSNYMTPLSLSPVSNHFDLSTSNEAGIKTALYGLPEIFHGELGSQKPILLELIDSQQNSFFSYSNSDSVSAVLREFSDNHSDASEQYIEALSRKNSGFFLVNTQPEDVTEFLDVVDNNTQLIITSLTSDGPANTFTNIPLNDQRKISSHQDIAPTLLNLLGCNIAAEQHSTGQNLLSNSRNWVVSYHENKIIILHDDLRTEIDPNGNFQMLDYENEPVNNGELNIPLVGQAVKLLSSFSQ